MLQKNRFALLLVLCCLWASADGVLQSDCSGFGHPCETRLLSTSPGSSVLLPCNLSSSEPQDEAVSWTHSPDPGPVLTLTSAGRVNFFRPRSGRINAFPNQASLGNFSISIDNVNDTDLGCYTCFRQNECVQVELARKTESEVWLFPFYIYIVSAVAAFILLSVGCCIFIKCFIKRNNETENYNVTVHEAIDDLSHPAQETGRESGDGQQQEAEQLEFSSYENVTVYENNYVDDEPDYLNEIPGHCVIDREEACHSGQFMRMESQRTKQRFHTELFSRLRQASIRKHHYVNQDELRRQQENTHKDSKKKKERYGQFPNPIYNRSTDNLDQL